MCANCDAPMPEELASTVAIGMADVANEMERQNDMQVRLAALKLAVEVKGKPDADGTPASSQKILSSAHAYYDFLTNRSKDVK